MGLNYSQIQRNVKRARKLTIRATAAAGSGHPGGSFSMAEIVGVLLFNRLKHDPKNPLWEGRDKLVLSKGHAAPGLFSSLAVEGYFDVAEVDTLRKLGSRLQGHPDLKCPGVEFCGGSLGIGLSFSIGSALAARMDGSGQRIFTILGDGESDEGQVWEAAMTGAKYKTDNLTAIMDRNFIQQDSYTENVMPLDEELAGGDPSEMWRDSSRWKTGDKWRSFGWNVIEIDGHRIEQIDGALTKAASVKGVPSIIIARTTKGKGVEHMEGNPKWHGKAPARDMVPIIDAEIDCQFMIAPSIIAGNMGDLAGEVKRCADGGADYIHMDVMDGRFVPNKTFGHSKIRELRSITDIPFDTHLMIDDPRRHVRRYAEAGSDIITVHAEVTDASAFGEIHDYLRGDQVGVGLAINPDTDIPEWAHGFIRTLDQVIVMSVVPGRSGQKYIEATHKKMEGVMRTLREHGFEGYVEADGGVNAGNAGECFSDGARAFVGGGAIVGTDDIRGAISRMRDSIVRQRRRVLLERAHGTGGAEMVRRWIDLHEDPAKMEALREIATEMSFV